jgi:flavorubredoxin
VSITNKRSGTNIVEVGKNIYRINTPVPPSQIPGGFSFNQYLIVDEAPLLFHTGPRKLFDVIREAVASVMPVAKLRYVSFSHTEADECGSLDKWLEAAPEAVPLCGTIAAMVSVGDMTDRPVRALADGEEVSLGHHRVKWLDAPHLPHSWDCGFLMEMRTRTFFCGDLFTQGGNDLPAITENDILGPSEAFRRQMDYYAHAKNTRALLEKLASENPTTLACMHGSAWKGDGGKLLRALADSLGTQP